MKSAPVLLSPLDTIEPEGIVARGGVWGDADPWHPVSAIDALQESQRFIDRVAHASPVILYVFDLSLNRTVFYNDAVDQILGYAPDEIRRMGGSLIPALIHPDDQPVFSSTMARLAAAADRDLVESEVRVRHASGEWRWLATRETVFLRDGGGAPRQVLGAAMDITDRKRAETALRDSQQRYALASAAGRVAVWDFDVASGRMRTEPAISELLGWEPGEAGAHDGWEEFIHPDDRERVLRLSAEVLDTTAPRDAEGNTPCPEIEYRALGRDGAVHWLADRGTVVRHPNGEPYRVVGTITEITQRKLAEIALREGQQRYALATSAGRVVVWDYDITTNRLRTEPPLAELLGFAPGEERAGDGWTEFLHPEDRERVLRHSSRLLDPDAPRDAEGNTPCPEAEYRVIGLRGAVYWLADRGTVLRLPGGEPYRAVGTITDITERKRVEDELRKVTSEILRAQDDERRRIASDLHDGVAQDLTAIVVYLMRIEALATGLHLPDEVQAVLATTQELGERALRELRTLSYLLHPPLLEEGGLPIAIRDYASGFAARTGIEVDVADIEAIGELPPDAQAALYRVVQECLVNIQRHSRSPSAAIYFAVRLGEIVLEIRDHGRGMTAGRQRTTNAPPVQAGVGIASMRERLHHLGGRLEIRTGSSGTTVIARLPRPGAH